MKKKILYVLALGVLLVGGVTIEEVSATDAPSSKSRLYNRGKAEVPSSTSSFGNAPLRSGGSEPGLGNAIGMLGDDPDPVPVGGAAGFVLLAGLAYVGFAFVRKRKSVN